MPMFWYDAGSWKTTNNLWVYDGSWKLVLNCWIWDTSSSSWRVCFTPTASLDSFGIFNFGGGSLEASWTYTANVGSDWRMYLDYSTDSGVTWANLSNHAVTASPLAFTGSSSDWYRLRMVFATDTSYAANGSPIVVSPPYPT